MVETVLEVSVKMSSRAEKSEENTKGRDELYNLFVRSLRLLLVKQKKEEEEEEKEVKEAKEVEEVVEVKVVEEGEDAQEKGSLVLGSPEEHATATATTNHTNAATTKSYLSLIHPVNMKELLLTECPLLDERHVSQLGNLMHNQQQLQQQQQQQQLQQEQQQQQPPQQPVGTIDHSSNLKQWYNYNRWISDNTAWYTQLHATMASSSASASTTTPAQPQYFGTPRTAAECSSATPSLPSPPYSTKVNSVFSLASKFFKVTFGPFFLPPPHNTTQMVGLCINVPNS